jgi:hypothetical protein
MEKVTVVAEAKPARICVVGKTCFKSMKVVELAATETADAIATPLRVKVKVAAVAAVLATAMLEIIAVVRAGVV